MMTAVVKKTTSIEGLGETTAALGAEGSLHEAHADTLSIHPDDFSAPLHFVLIGGKRSGHNDIAANAEASFDLYVGPTGAQILDDAFKQLTVGGKMRFHEAGFAGVQAGIARFNATPPQYRGGFGSSGLRSYAFHHVITIYSESMASVTAGSHIAYCGRRKWGMGSYRTVVNIFEPVGSAVKPRHKEKLNIFYHNRIENAFKFLCNSPPAAVFVFVV